MPEPCPKGSSAVDSSFTAVCRSSRCLGVDLRTDVDSACAVDADCVPRFPGCCESCAGEPTSKHCHVLLAPRAARHERHPRAARTEGVEGYDAFATARMDSLGSGSSPHSLWTRKLATSPGRVPGPKPASKPSSRPSL